MEVLIFLILMILWMFIGISSCYFFISIFDVKSMTYIKWVDVKDRFVFRFNNMTIRDIIMLSISAVLGLLMFLMIFWLIVLITVRDNRCSFSSIINFLNRPVGKK